MCDVNVTVPVSEARAEENAFIAFTMNNYPRRNLLGFQNLTGLSITHG
jgi:hypothetical protein